MELCLCRKINCQYSCLAQKTGCLPVRGSRLLRHRDFYQYNCPICGKAAQARNRCQRQFFGLAFTFYATSPSTDDTQPWNTALVQKWRCAMYMRAEHSVLHLMYARFITMAPARSVIDNHLDASRSWHDYQRRRKDSKSKGNIINPDDYLTRFGADVVRVSECLMGPTTRA